MTRLQAILLAGSACGVVNGMIVGFVGQAAEATGDWRLTLGALIMLAQALAFWIVLAARANRARLPASE